MMYGDPILLFGVAVAPVWFLAGVIVITSCAAEVAWDEEALRRAMIAAIHRRSASGP